MARRTVRRAPSRDQSTNEAEVQPPWRGRHSFELNSSTVLRDAYRLLSLVLADEAIAIMCEDERDDLAQLRDQFIEDELIHLLISTAVMNRTQDDHMGGPRNDASELSFRPVDQICGVLQENVAESDEEQPLTFREACNKIIHATMITAETEEIEGHAYRVLPPSVILRGMRGRAPWQAYLNIPNYARATWQNFHDLR